MNKNPGGYETTQTLPIGQNLAEYNAQLLRFYSISALAVKNVSSGLFFINFELKIVITSYAAW